MASKNEITGDNLVSKPTNPSYENGWDLIWGKRKLFPELVEGLEELKKRREDETNAGV